MIEPSVRRPVVADAVFSRLMDVLAGGSFLAGLGLLAGANNFTLGLLAALPILAQVAQLPAVAILLRVQDRRRLVVVCAGLARGAVLGLAVVLLVAPDLLTSQVLLWTFAVSAVLAVFATAAWNWWMRDLLPAQALGALFGARLRGATLASLVVMLAAGAVLDGFVRRGQAETGFALIFGAAGLAGLAGIAVLARTPHPAAPPSPPASKSFRLLAQALRQAPKSLLATLSFSAVAATFALPFAAIFLLRGLGYSYFTATALALLSQVAYLTGLRAWAHLSDKHGDRAVLRLTLSLLTVCMLGWAAAGWTSRPFLFAWVGALHFGAGFALGGLELASTNLLLRSAPPDNAAAHLAGVSLVRAAVAGSLVLASALLWQVLGPGVLWRVDLGVFGVWQLSGFQVLCAVAIVPTVAAAAGAARLPSSGPRHMTELARIMRGEVHQLSSIAGIRGLLHAVSYSVEFMAWPFAARRRRGLAPRVGWRRQHRQGPSETADESHEEGEASTPP